MRRLPVYLVTLMLSSCMGAQSPQQEPVESEHWYMVTADSGYYEIHWNSLGVALVYDYQVGDSYEVKLGNELLGEMPTKLTGNASYSPSIAMKIMERLNDGEAITSISPLEGVSLDVDAGIQSPKSFNLDASLRAQQIVGPSNGPGVTLDEPIIDTLKSSKES